MLKICLCLSLAVNFVIILFVIVTISNIKQETLQVIEILESDEIASKEELLLKLLEVHCCESEMNDIRERLEEIENGKRDNYTEEL